jgi:chemotaxis protein CheD
MNRYWEPKLDAFVVSVLPGELYVTSEDVVIATVLGSCVSACVRDVWRGTGGMNHFMLPDAVRGDDGDSARYGVYALECLINQVLGIRGTRADLEVKVFGGGQVIDAGTDIGRSNIEVMRRFFAEEGIAIHREDVGGKVARRVRYWPKTGRAQLQSIPMTRARRVVASERTARRRLTLVPGAIELF